MSVPRTHGDPYPHVAAQRRALDVRPTVRDPRPPRPPRPPAAARPPTAAPPPTELPPRRRLPRPERWAVLTTLACAVAFLALTAAIAVPGPVRDLDWWLWNQGFEWRYPGKRVMTALAVVGQRGPALVFAFLLVARIARRLRTWRPLVVLAGSQLLLNVVVGALKYGLGRAKAETGSAELLAGGTMYPSGHSSNAVVVWGVLVYLLIVYGGARRRRLLVGLAVVPSVVVAAATLFIGSHWLTDVIGGALAGIALLTITITVDRRWPSRAPGSSAPAVPDAYPVPPERPARAGAGR